MRKTYKLTLTLTAEMDDKTAEWYRESMPDMHEALITSEKAELKMEETKEQPQEQW